MKFTIDRTIMHTQTDRVCIMKREEDYFSSGRKSTVKYMCQALIQVTGDFNMDDEFIIASDTDSVQFRPKSLFRAAKGIFYKGKDKKRVYLTEAQRKEMVEFMIRAEVFIFNLPHE